MNHQLYCTRCGRNNHTVERCYAKTHYNGGKLSTPPPVVAPPFVTPSTPKPPPIYTPPTLLCAQCGRWDHLTVHCPLSEESESDSQSSEVVVPVQPIVIKGCKNVTNVVGSRDMTFIKEWVQFGSGEVLDVLYLFQAMNFGRIGFGDVFVGVTNYRIFRFEEGLVDTVLLGDIIEIEHERNIICWNNIVCRLRDGSKHNIGIYTTTACQCVCIFLNKCKGIRFKGG